MDRSFDQRRWELSKAREAAWALIGWLEMLKLPEERARVLLIANRLREMQVDQQGQGSELATE